MSLNAAERGPRSGRFQFGGGNRVIFIDDGKHAEAEQLFHGVLQVRVAPPIREIFLGEQYLRDFYVPGGEKILVRVHQQALADGGAGLLGYQVRQARAVQAEPAAAESNRARRDEHDLAPIFHETRNRADDRFDAFVAELAVIGGDGAGSDLDDDPARACRRFSRSVAVL